MIKITKDDKYARCNSCHSDKNVKAVVFWNYNHNGISISLCKDCREQLMHRLKDEFTEFGV